MQFLLLSVAFHSEQQVFHITQKIPHLLYKYKNTKD